MDSLPFELKIAVFEHLKKEDLLSSALVCRTWKEVAWDKVMWQTCTILLSGLLGSLVGDDNHPREIYNDDLDRFFALAARATRICLDVNLVDILIDFILEVAGYAPGKILFPAMHTLDCGEFDDIPQGDLAHTVFAGSPIKHIEIHGGRSEEGAVVSRQLFSSLLAAYPQVQEVAAFEDRLPESVGIPEFWRLPNLRSLTYSGSISYEEWTKVIQGCPVLNEVRLIGSTRRPVPPQAPSVPALSLHRLNLEDFWSSELTISILESIDAAHLMALDLDIEPHGENGEGEHPSAGRARSAFRLLAKRSQQLESLTVNTSIKLGAETLAAFSSLRRLKILDSTPGCQLDDNGIELLCRSHPNLREFHLVYYQFSRVGDYANISLKSLSSFSRHCRNLTSLGLPVTATKPEDFAGNTLTELMAFPDHLKCLKLTALTLGADRTEDFTSFLILHCPKLTDLDIYSLVIADQKISYSALTDMKKEIKDAYFRAQVAL